jgi:hypothetical protein
MIRAKRCTDTGRPLSDIFLDLSPTEAGLRIFQKLSMAKSDGLTDEHLAQVDTGIDFSVLAKLFTPAEITQAIHGRLAKVAPGSNEYQDLTAMLRDAPAWRRAQGGDEARRHGGLRPSSTKSCGEVAHECGYHDVSGKGSHFAHPDGHAVALRGSGAWQHTGIEPGRSVRGTGPDELRRHLERVHGGGGLAKSGAACHDVLSRHGWVMKGSAASPREYRHELAAGHSIEVWGGDRWRHVAGRDSIFGTGSAELDRHLGLVGKALDPEG